MARSTTSWRPIRGPSGETTPRPTPSSASRRSCPRSGTILSRRWTSPRPESVRIRRHMFFVFVCFVYCRHLFFHSWFFFPFFFYLSRIDFQYSPLKFRRALKHADEANHQVRQRGSSHARYHAAQASVFCVSVDLAAAVARVCFARLKSVCCVVVILVLFLIVCLFLFFFFFFFDIAFLNRRRAYLGHAILSRRQD